MYFDALLYYINRKKLASSGSYLLPALSLLRSKKRYYFAIDELSGQLLYYKDEADLVAKREPIGTLPLANAAFTIVEGNDRIFVLHKDVVLFSSSDKVVELEALNPESCECWLKALSHRFWEKYIDVISKKIKHAIHTLKNSYRNLPRNLTVTDGQIIASEYE
ncbi:unnamed protein product [Haemonchus placei]|uniref:PH domain-containing protein n=1 Tax=Haemonchus placei TaxID=6290 RepID=A0A0N4W5C4_HAEPC|nr:unnamed protein product [Haemonchus placei]